jgi:hypothetical protein
MDIEKGITVPRDLVAEMFKRLQHLEEGIGRIYQTHRNAGCTPSVQNV